MPLAQGSWAEDLAFQPPMWLMPHAKPEIELDTMGNLSVYLAGPMRSGTACQRNPCR